MEAQRVCAALIKRGYRITVVCAGGPPMPPVRDWIDPKGVPVRIYAMHGKGVVKNTVFALQVARMLIWERRTYNFVYFLMQGMHLAFGLPVARVLGKPIIMKVAGSGEVLRMSKSMMGRQELRWLRKWAHCVMILNEGMRSEAIESGFSPESLHWMPNPIDTDEFGPTSPGDQRALRSRCGIPASARVIIYCGRLAPEKALPSLLDAFAMVAREDPDALLVMIGDGPMRNELDTQVRQLGLPEQSVRFTGRMEPDDVSSWLKIGDLFALVSFSEGFPCSLAEAMSTGIPSVVSDIPANRQLIEDGKQGFLVPVSNSKAIADAILRLLRNVELRRHMGQLARQSILNNYSTAQVADRYETIFQSLT
jgi:glycosyltransferase involved in cell wall biosynthesis